MNSGTMHSWLLTDMVFAPAIGALLLAVMPGAAREALRRAAVGISLIPFAIAMWVWSAYDPTTADFQFVTQIPWISDLGISYFIGVDGISLLLILLTVFLTPLVLISAVDQIHKRMKSYLIAVLLLETTMLGTLVALDLALFYVFWELMLVPMFLIIGVWGGSRRVYAAIKFVLFTMVGSLPMLVAIIYLATQGGGDGGGDPSFALMSLYDVTLSPAAQFWCCLAFVVAFAIKVPMFPLHTWLPDAHVEAPTGGSVILAGVLLKMGTYGFVRFVLPLFPEVWATFIPWIGVLAVIGIIYGALVAMVQPDMKKLVAYSSVSHLGFVMLGLISMNVVGLEGAIYQMVGHGLSTGGLFLLVGMIYERRHTREISEFGGLWKQLPVFSVCFLIVMLASIGLPGLNGFIGEFLILLGTFQNHPYMVAFAVSGVVFGAVYMLWMFQRVIFGPVDNPENATLSDLTRRELTVILPVIAMIVIMGVYPRPFIATMQKSVEATLVRAGVGDAEQHHHQAHAQAGAPGAIVIADNDRLLVTGTDRAHSLHGSGSMETQR